MMKILVTGARGMLGSDLIPLLKEEGNEVSGFNREDIDITDVENAIRVVKEVSPDIVINTAAYTAVDAAETDIENAFLVNANGPGNLSKACEDSGARLIHISTDFVFDGSKNTPYTELDPVSPIGAYGTSKFEGERQLQANCDDFIIVRTSWLYGVHGHNFVSAILNKAAEEEELRVVCDQVGSPTFTVDLACGIVELIKAQVEAGIYHFSSEGVASWYDFACLAVSLAKRSGVSLKVESITPVLTSEYPRPAKRPVYSVLDKQKYRRSTGKAVPSWIDGLERYMALYMKEVGQ